MHRTTKIVAGGVLAAAALAGGTGLAVAGTEDDNEGPDVPISGDALDQASRAALDFTGGGEVTGTEVGDEESVYEVEVTLDDGSHVDVQLDESFTVVSSENEGPEDIDD